MKQFFSLLAIAFVFSACNNASKDAAVSRNEKDLKETALQEAIVKFPDSLLLKENLVQYYRDSAEYEKAITLINTTLQKDSNNQRLWDIKATLHFENEDTLNAIKAFEQAYAIYPNPSYIMSLGSLYAETKNARALALADAFGKNGDAAIQKNALFIKGLYYNYTGDKNKAISYFDNCLAIDYTFMFAYREKAIALYDAGKFEEALAVLKKATTLQNNFDEGYYWMGRCLEKLNRLNEATDNYKRALLYDPEFVDAREALERLEGK